MSLLVYSTSCVYIPVCLSQLGSVLYRPSIAPTERADKQLQIGKDLAIPLLLLSLLMKLASANLCLTPYSVFGLMSTGRLLIYRHMLRVTATESGHQRKHIENTSSKRKSKLEEYKARVSCQLVCVVYRNTSLPLALLIQQSSHFPLLLPKRAASSRRGHCVHHQSPGRKETWHIDRQRVDSEG